MKVPIGDKVFQVIKRVKLSKEQLGPVEDGILCTACDHGFSWDLQIDINFCPICGCDEGDNR